MISLVLSVDDDKVTQMLNQMIFTRSSFSTKSIAFMNGKEILTFFEQRLNKDISPVELPAIIFLDLNMPVMGGWEFLESFCSNYACHFPEIKVVILSSTINPEEKQKAISNDNVIDFLSKPLTLEMIDHLKQHPAIQKYFSGL